MSKRQVAAVLAGGFLIVLGVVLMKTRGHDATVVQQRREVEFPRPSPLDEELTHPTLQIVPDPGESVRTRVAEAAKSTPATESFDRVPGNNWAVVAAIYKDYDAAEKRARKMGADSNFTPTVFPDRGQASKYMVLVGSGLTRTKAEALRIRAAAAGFPSDMYVTRLASE